MRKESCPVRGTILLLALLPVLVLCIGCAGKDKGSVQAPAASARTSWNTPEAEEGRELMAGVSSREEAEEIALLYGIELVDCSEYIACFHTEEDLGEVINRGKENGWPPLEINFVITLDDPVGTQTFPGRQNNSGVK